MPENDKKDIEGVNFTRSGIRVLPEQMLSADNGKKKKLSVEDAISEEFRELIKKTDNYRVLITEDFKTARLLFAREFNYEVNFSVESAFLGHAYFLSLGKHSGNSDADERSADFWVQAGFEDEFRKRYQEFMQNFSGEHYRMKIVEYGSPRKL